MSSQSSSGRVTVTLDDDVRYAGSYLLVIDGRETLRFRGPQEMFEVETEPGRRKVQVFSKHRASTSNTLMLEVLPGEVSPLLLSLSDAASGPPQALTQLTVDMLHIRRLDNDPGKPTR